MREDSQHQDAPSTSKYNVSIEYISHTPGYSEKNEMLRCQERSKNGKPIQKPHT
jgi:hypothetical protein